MSAILPPPADSLGAAGVGLDRRHAPMRAALACG
jgi:hypothetical protein